MDFLRGYSGLSEYKSRFMGETTPPVLSGAQPIQRQGMMRGPGAMDLSYKSQYLHALDTQEHNTREALTDVQGQFQTANEEVMNARSTMDQQYDTERKKLGSSAFEYSQRHYDKLDREEFTDLYVLGKGGLEGSYRIHPDDLNTAWEEALAKGEDFPLSQKDLGMLMLGPDVFKYGTKTPTGTDENGNPTYQTDPNTINWDLVKADGLMDAYNNRGKMVNVINVGAYGKESHESLAAMPVTYLNTIYESVEPKWTQASNQLDESYTEGMSQISKHQRDLDKEGVKLGRMMADYQTETIDPLKGTVVDESYGQRRHQRKVGFGVMTGGGQV